jgi:hypothetical protein
VFLASANLGIAATMGVLLGFDKTNQFLPGFVLSNVFAHAHMAALGWAALMAFGLAGQLLPETPPRVPAAPRALLAGTGLFVSLLRQSSWSILSGVCTMAGLAALVFHLAASVRHAVATTPEGSNGRPESKAPLDAVPLHGFCAFLWLLVAAGLGTYLLIQPLSDMALRAALAYGAVGLLGFLGQLVLAIRVRLLQCGANRLQPFVLCAWTLGVAGIALGLAADHEASLAIGAVIMLSGVLLEAPPRG